MIERIFSRRCFYKPTRLRDWYVDANMLASGKRKRLGQPLVVLVVIIVHDPCPMRLFPAMIDQHLFRELDCALDDSDSGSGVLYCLACRISLARLLTYAGQPA